MFFWQMMVSARRVTRHVVSEFDWLKPRVGDRILLVMDGSSLPLGSSFNMLRGTATVEKVRAMQGCFVCFLGHTINVAYLS